MNTFSQFLSHVSNTFRYVLRPRQYTWPALLRQMAVNAGLVLLALLLLNFTHLGEQLAHKVQDKLMYWHSDFPVKVDGKEPRLGLIKIDENLHRDWGSPLLTPRDKLKTLIEHAVADGAKTIVVDIDLSWQGDGCLHEPDKPVACPTANLSADRALGEYLKSLNESTAPDAPIVILTRLYRRPPNQAHGFMQAAPSFLDEYLGEARRVFWSTAFFEQDADEVLRRWHLAPLICHEGHLNIVPSAALLAALAHLHTQPGDTRAAAEALQALNSRWAHWAKQFSCDAAPGTTVREVCAGRGDCAALRVALPTKTGVKAHPSEVDLTAGSSQHTIAYRFAPPDKPDAAYGSLIDEHLAAEVLKQPPGLMQEQLVFIGTAYADEDYRRSVGDHHRIPIRERKVDGVYVLANATDTLLRFGQFQSPPPLEQAILYGVVILAAILLFTFYEVITAFVLCSLVIGIGLYFWGIFDLRAGVLLEIGLPLFIPQFILVIWHYLENFIEFRHRVKGHHHE